MAEEQTSTPTDPSPSPAQPAPEASAASEKPSPAPQSTPDAAATKPADDESAPGGMPTTQPLSDELSKQIDAAMEASTPADQAGPGKGMGKGGKPGGIRGPRVVGGQPSMRTGKVVNVTENDIFLEFGPKELGIVSRDQWREGENLPETGQELEVIIERFDKAESIFVCARPGAIRKAIWDTLQSGQVIEATCVATNKGGLEMELAGGHRAFLPASQVAIERVNDLDKFIGQKLECEVQRVDRRGGGNVVLSRRTILEKERAKEAEKLKDTLAVGQVVEGTVQRIAPFGAFVDIGGIDGLVHVSDLSHERIGQGEAAVRKMVSEGQQVRVEILKLDWENQRIGLGMKQLQADPYAEKMGAIEEGAEVSGRVTKIMDFGAFVELAPGVEGLIHISELDHKRVKAVSDAVKPDEVVNVKVLSVDPGSRRIGLSMKALKPAPAGGKGGKGERGPSAEEILKETPQLRRLREKFGGGGLRGGLG
ncbi:MAG: S1 RNA-binding domain-containing protein [Phycisphaera sp.]|nr:MAG: S1 RNA-binding domain-containing protein [Phycisphaera sp.]